MTGNFPWLLLAHILRPQGRKGEVLADLHTDHPERFAGESRVFLAPPGFSGPATGARAAQVSGSFLPVGRNAGRIVIQFSSVTSITEAEALSGLDVLVPGEERLELEEDASYISDLLDCRVYDAPDASAPSTLVGTVEAVHFPTNPEGTKRLEQAAPLLSVLSPDGKEILIPYVKAYLIEHDISTKRILMSLPPGLIDLNA